MGRQKEACLRLLQSSVGRSEGFGSAGQTTLVSNFSWQCDSDT